jgi:Spy/CpxP family protein refolding chaperone
MVTERIMKNTKARLEAAALFLMVFALGVTFGAVGNRIWNQRVSGEPSAVTPKLTRDQVMQDLTQKLQLTPEQQKQIGAEFDDTRAKRQALSAQLDSEREVIQQQREAILQQFRTNVRAILTPDQQAKFDELLEQRKREAEKHPVH